MSTGQAERQIGVSQAIFPHTFSVCPKLNPLECFEFDLNTSVIYLFLKTDTHLPTPMTAFSLDQSVVSRKTFSLNLEATLTGVYLILLCMLYGTK